jgi:hypothetical protein
MFRYKLRSLFWGCTLILLQLELINLRWRDGANWDWREEWKISGPELVIWTFMMFLLRTVILDVVVNLIM